MLVVTFVVEAYLSVSHRLLWRATEEDRGSAYWLALRAEADPRLEVRVIEVRDDAADAPSPVERPARPAEPKATPAERPTTERPIVLPRSAEVPRPGRPKRWLVCRTD